MGRRCTTSPEPSSDPFPVESRAGDRRNPQLQAQRAEVGIRFRFVCRRFERTNLGYAPVAETAAVDQPDRRDGVFGSQRAGVAPFQPTAHRSISKLSSVSAGGDTSLKIIFTQSEPRNGVRGKGVCTCIRRMRQRDGHYGQFRPSFSLQVARRDGVCLPDPFTCFF